MMDVYHPEFRDTIAIDNRIKKISRTLALRFLTYEEEEEFYRGVARKAGVNAWELDRILYGFRDRVIDRLEAPEVSKTTLKHVKNFLSGVFRHAAQQGYFDGANPVKLAEIPAFAPNGGETFAYSLEEITAMVKVLSEPSATAVATAAFTGLRLGELRGLTWESYSPAQDDETFGWLNVTRSVWRTTVGDPKTAKSKAPVPVIPQLAEKLEAHRKLCGNAVTGPIFANSVGHPLDLNACYQREMRDVLRRAKLSWHGWHGFRRGLASNLNHLGVDDSVIQRILRHSNLATTQNHYIKTASPDAIAAMRQFSQALLCFSGSLSKEVRDVPSVQ